MCTAQLEKLRASRRALPCEQLRGKPQAALAAGPGPQRSQEAQLRKRLASIIVHIEVGCAVADDVAAERSRWRGAAQQSGGGPAAC